MSKNAQNSVQNNYPLLSADVSDDLRKTNHRMPYHSFDVDTPTYHMYVILKIVIPLNWPFG